MELSDLINVNDSKLIFDALTKAGGNNRFVGGCVRNALLDLPIKDIDIGTTLTPDDVETAFANAPGVKIIAVGKSHGTIMIVLNKHVYEITTLRRDIETDGRFATVEYTNDWMEDAARRDFTINALSYDPITNELFDYFKGRKDLETGTIRFVLAPTKRVEEDHLRILRLFRFYTYYGKTIDQPSLDACIKYAGKLKNISNERKMSELFKIIEHERYLATLKLMQKCNALEYLHPIGMEWINAIKLCARMESIAEQVKYKTDMPLRLFTLLAGGEVLNQFKVIESLSMLSAHSKQHLKRLLKFTQTATVSKLEADPYRFLYFFRELLLDGFIYFAACEPNLTNLQEKFEELDALARVSINKFPLTGNDLIEQFNIKPGAKLGDLLDKVRDLWFKSKCTASKDMLSTQAKQYL